MGIVVVLHNIRSLYNVGSIFRTADAAGVKKIYLCGITPSPLDRFDKKIPQFAKVSLGAEDYVEWDASAHSTSSGQARSARATLQLLEKLKKDGYQILAVEQSKDSVPYYKANLLTSDVDKLVLVLGNEVEGLPPSILKRVDKILEIPMRGAMVRQAHHPRQLGRGKESLNVSVAFAIVIFHLLYSHVPVR